MAAISANASKTAPVEPNEDEDDQTASSVSDYNIPVAALMIHAELPYGLKKVRQIGRMHINRFYVDIFDEFH